MIAAANAPKVDVVGPLLHAARLALTSFWWVWLLLAAVGAVRLAFWVAEQRRIARSGIDEIDRMTGVEFEQRLAFLFRSLGYRVEQTRAHGDYGADLIVAREGKKTVVQAKRWTKPVGVKAIQEAVAAKPVYGCDGAIVVTNSRFTAQARTLADANQVDLWDRDGLIRHLAAASEDVADDSVPAGIASAPLAPADRVPTLSPVALPEVTIYTDGACSGNGRADPRGGWAAVLTAPGTEPKQLSGGEKPTTNQRMELTAAIEGLKALKMPCKVIVYADSAYLVNGMRERWHVNWRRNGWKNSKRQPVANQELWEELVDLVENRGHDVTFLKVKGHADRTSGHVSSEHERFNQLCDQLAVAAVPA